MNFPWLLIQCCYGLYTEDLVRFCKLKNQDLYEALASISSATRYIEYDQTIFFS